MKSTQKIFIIFLTLIMPLSLSSFDHSDGPEVRSIPMGDIGGLYSWVQNESIVILMTVNDEPHRESNTGFSSKIAYKIHVDNTGDAREEITISAVFSQLNNSRQFIRMTGLPNGEVVEGEINTGKSSTEKIVKSPSGEVSVFAGPRDDPFYFDLDAYNRGMSFTNPGADHYKGKNCLAIAIQMPVKYFLQKESSNSKIGLWAATYQ